MRVELTTEECRWLADLAGKAKMEAAQAHEEMPHKLFALRRDNMADLENKLNTAISRRTRSKNRRCDRGER